MLIALGTSSPALVASHVGAAAGDIADWFWHTADSTPPRGVEPEMCRMLPAAWQWSCGRSLGATTTRLTVGASAQSSPPAYLSRGLLGMVGWSARVYTECMPLLLDAASRAVWPRVAGSLILMCGWLSTAQPLHATFRSVDAFCVALHTVAAGSGVVLVAVGFALCAAMIRRGRGPHAGPGRAHGSCDCACKSKHPFLYMCGTLGVLR